MDTLSRIAVAIACMLALGACGIRAPASAADRERAAVLATQAQTQLQSGDQDGALQSLSESIRLDPQAGALRARASVHVARGEFDAALQDADHVIGSRSATAADYSLRCWLRARDDDALRSARADCDRALELDPTLASALGGRGLVGLKQGRNREAWDDFNAALTARGSEAETAWRLFGRGLAAWNQGEQAEGRQDIERALRADPSVAAQFAQFGLGGEVVREFDDATFATAVNPPSLWTLQAYLTVYAEGAHAEEARAKIAEIQAGLAEAEASGRRTVPGFSLVQVRGAGPASDSFGAIAISRASWRVAFATDYATGDEAMRAAADACNRGGTPDCQAYTFRNVCAALAISPRERARGMAWSHGQDNAMYTAVTDCRDNGGRSCVPVHSQCTPTPQAPASTPATSP